MDNQWKPDIVDYDIFDKDKADYIYAEVSQYLASTIKISDSLEDKVFKILTLLVAILTALIGFLYLKCDFVALTCAAGGKNTIISAIILFGGFAISALILVVKCVSPKPYALNGNQPRNLIRNDLCSMPIVSMKISSVIDMENRINNNLCNLSRTAKYLKYSLYVAVVACILAMLVGVLANFS